MPPCNALSSLERSLRALPVGKTMRIGRTTFRRVAPLAAGRPTG